MKTYLKVSDIAGLPVGHVPLGFSGTFRLFLEQGCVITCEPIAMPCPSFPPWPQVQKRRGCSNPMWLLYQIYQMSHQSCWICKEQTEVSCWSDGRKRYNEHPVTIINYWNNLVLSFSKFVQCISFFFKKVLWLKKNNPSIDYAYLSIFLCTSINTFNNTLKVKISVDNRISTCALLYVLFHNIKWLY
jgi:hypothetical protein